MDFLGFLGVLSNTLVVGNNSARKKENWTGDTKNSESKRRNGGGSYQAKLNVSKGKRMIFTWLVHQRTSQADYRISPTQLLDVSSVHQIIFPF